MNCEQYNYLLALDCLKIAVAILSMVHLTYTQMVITYCEHDANSALFFAILQCGHTSFSSKGHFAIVNDHLRFCIR